MRCRPPPSSRSAGPTRRLRRSAPELPAPEVRESRFSREFVQARVEIHIPSLSIDEHLRLGARQFVTLQTLQMGRCAAAANPAVHVVYVSAVAIPEDVLEYHCRLLDAGADPHARGAASRITVVVPEVRLRISCSSRTGKRI